MRRYATWLAMAGIALPTGCGDVEDGDESIASNEPRAVYGVGHAWPQRQLRVCFWAEEATDTNDPNPPEPGSHPEQEPSASVVEDAKPWVASAARRWSAVSGIRFTGFGDCAGEGDGDISIRLNPANGGGSSRVGSASAEAYPSMELPVWFPGVSKCDEKELGPNGKTKLRNCVEGYAMHELGHALGLLHEMVHPDSDCNTDETLESFGIDGEPIWGFDAASVMNYCNEEHLTNPRLALGDVRAITTLYPAQVVTFSDAAFTGDRQSLSWGSWRGCVGDLKNPAGSEISSIVIPPGMRAKVCTDAAETTCQTFTDSVVLHARRARVREGSEGRGRGRMPVPRRPRGDGAHPGARVRRCDLVHRGDDARGHVPRGGLHRRSVVVRARHVPRERRHARASCGDRLDRDPHRLPRARVHRGRRWCRRG